MKIIGRDSTPFSCDNCWKPHEKRMEFENGVIDLCQECFDELHKKMGEENEKEKMEIYQR